MTDVNVNRLLAIKREWDEVCQELYLDGFSVRIVKAPMSGSGFSIEILAPDARVSTPRAIREDNPFTKILDAFVSGTIIPDGIDAETIKEEAGQESIPDYGKDGDALRRALPSLEIGSRLLYFGVVHDVIDAGEQGKRIAARPTRPSERGGVDDEE